MTLLFGRDRVWASVMALAGALVPVCRLTPTSAVQATVTPETGPVTVRPAAETPTAGATRPVATTTRPAKVLFQEPFSQGLVPASEKWTVRNPDQHRVVIREGVLVAHAEARDHPSRIEFQIGGPQEPVSLPSLGHWTLEFDALVSSLWGRGRGEVRVELRDFATRRDPEGTDFVLAERYWNDQSGLKFGLFHGGAFVGWHEIAPVGQLGAWHHYRVEYAAGALTLWRDHERTLECDVTALLDRPLIEGVAIEMGFHIPTGCGIEGCIDNVTVTSPDDEDATATKPSKP